MKLTDKVVNSTNNEHKNSASSMPAPSKPKTLLDPLCHYNTSLKSNLQKTVLLCPLSVHIFRFSNLQR